MVSKRSHFTEATVENQETSPLNDSTDTTMLQPVVLPHPYVDRNRLLRQLRNRFGEDNFRVQVCDSGKSFPDIKELIDHI